MNIDNVVKEIKFDEKGLVPVVVQDVNTNKVLMLAYMNEEAIRKTLNEKVAYYYSRSRQELWKKGETSGNIQKLKGFYYDCDKDTILIYVDQIGVACHTGSYTCFFNEVIKNESKDEILEELYSLIKERKSNPKEGSYTNYLFEKGLDKILKKVGEEASEVIIGAKNKNKEELIYEISDLIYHMLVLMVNEEVTIEDIKNELEKRKN
ncbi:bifunctional phosphoribosyl-AMP cyclohydrolase/phosphoribosyl-ATP diphosphatase HisIE [Tepidibacter hydrothermalis]|uniref:Histidine biosynthesis bifunctional protein HisIE n=1 Tax=Tepidibacter hydrothermalis TaxID=3036126 RepID=A0ABY8EDZ2_9FIRM|nr:bifunctional phosphoribosyl-AMP cyclohydrolase/phosphoribosyl-ATP diphosphatase HisIE [Tepidibacter hydrothermalis]WFD11163.1 bifunctional phosphoribosyl-AMP cyclohydrolase/phosphoribosyl-ATP diphosphatase HisIE [Tepidibacter hydrothermalis]